MIAVLTKNNGLTCAAHLIGHYPVTFFVRPLGQSIFSQIFGFRSKADNQGRPVFMLAKAGQNIGIFSQCQLRCTFHRFFNFLLPAINRASQPPLRHKLRNLPAAVPYKHHTFAWRFVFLSPLPRQGQPDEQGLSPA